MSYDFVLTFRRHYQVIVRTDWLQFITNTCVPISAVNTPKYHWRNTLKTVWLKSIDINGVNMLCVWPILSRCASNQTVNCQFFLVLNNIGFDQIEPDCTVPLKKCKVVTPEMLYRLWSMCHLYHVEKSLLFRLVSNCLLCIQLYDTTPALL